MVINEKIQQLKENINYRYIHNKIYKLLKKDPYRYYYYFQVWVKTIQNKHKVSNIEKRSWDFHLDHVIPISYGFENHILPDIIGSDKNLRIISRFENRKKGKWVTDDVTTKTNELKIGTTKKTINISQPKVNTNKSSVTYWSKQNQKLLKKMSEL